MTGKVTLATKMDDGLELYRVTCPVGVLCIIFEARPEVNIQISCLALKSGNAVILKGGSEAAHSNKALVEIFREGRDYPLLSFVFFLLFMFTALVAKPAIGRVEGIPADSIQLVSSREAIDTLLTLDRYVDLIIPRGSADLVRSIKTRSRIPVLGHADGICSVYLDKEATLEKALKVAVDAKTNYVAACNSAETLLVHADLLNTPVFQGVTNALLKAGVKLRADKRSLAHLLSQDPAAVSAATEEDFSTEFLELVMAVKVVDSLEEAIDHINFHGSHHTDAIVTEDGEAAEKFMSLVDSGGVYHNASTRLADGFRYGFGAEIGVSTNKTHARGPVGLEGLVIYKYRVYGAGQGAAMYGAGEGKRKFLHTPIAPEDFNKRLKK